LQKVYVVKYSIPIIVERKSLICQREKFIK